MARPARPNLYAAGRTARPGRRRPRRTDAGFTLIELMVAMSIFAVLMTSFGLLFSSSLKAYRFARARTVADQVGSGELEKARQVSWDNLGTVAGNPPGTLVASQVVTVSPGASLAASFAEGRAAIKIDKKWGFIDRNDALVVAEIFDEVDNFTDGLATVRSKFKWGMIDKMGNETIPVAYDFIEGNSEGMVVVQIKGKFGILDKTGKNITPLKYDNILGFSEGFARVSINNKFGFIDKTGQEIIPLIYDQAYSFSEGMARISIFGHYGFVNKKGKESFTETVREVTKIN